MPDRPTPQRAGPLSKAGGGTPRKKRATDASGAPAVRRTQEARSAEMRVRLMDAAMDLLAERGYEQVSTTMIARRAGVSNGALTHHFPTKVELMGTAFETLLFEWQERRLRDLYPNDGPDPLGTYLRHCWNVVFSKPQYLGVVELMLTARGDEALRKRVKLALERYNPTRTRIERELLGFDIEDPVRGPILDLCLSVLRGMALQSNVNPSHTPDPELLETWLSMIALKMDEIDRAEHKARHTHHGKHHG